MIGILLAGGRATRLGGGDKGDEIVGGRAILDRVVATLRPQCDTLILSANGDPARFARLALPVVADASDEQPGPLAGLHAGLDYVAAHHPRCRFVVTVPTDAPFLPDDLVARLQDTRIADRAMIVCARSGGRPHYVAALWSVGLRHDLGVAMARDGVRQVRRFIERHPFAYADWPVTPVDPFFNVNTAEDLAEAGRLAALSAAAPSRP
jgi:molybdopterin-guanine dinucleotide biosynthesis protein A